MPTSLNASTTTPFAPATATPAAQIGDATMPLAGAAAPCAECGAAVAARFCAQCGERRLQSRDFSITALVAGALQNVLSFDNRLLHTVRDLLTRPGQLTADYMAGRRNRQTQPLTLFLTINVLFFVAIANSNLMAWKLVQYERGGLVMPGLRGVPVAAMIREREARDGVTPAVFARRYNGALRDRQKATLIIVVPLFAAAVGLATWRRRRPAVQHVVFAIHFYAFYLLLFGVGTRALLRAIYWLLRPVDARFAANLANGLGSEEGLTAMLVAGAALYLHAALVRAYALRSRDAWFVAIALSLVVLTGLTWLLRDLMFFFTLYTV